jgi:metal-dependent amidase/aminoacylase/carboxypeptidase family protein
MGIPGDEIHAPVVRSRGGGKAVTAEAGVWDDLDAILYAHPEFLDTVWLSSRWMSRRRIRLHGPRFFSADRQDIVATFANMLQSCRTLMNRYGAEWFVIEAASFEGDVEDGSLCGAELSVLIFGRDEDELQERVDELNGLVGEACAGSGLSPNIEEHPEGTRPVYQGILANSVLVSAIAAVFGESYVPASMQLPFATDFGNLSRRAPSALIGIGRPGGWRFHTEAGAEEFASQDGREVAARLAQVLALTVSTLTNDRDLLTRARAEFEARRAGRHSA